MLQIAARSRIACHGTCMRLQSPARMNQHSASPQAPYMANSMLCHTALRVSRGANLVHNMAIELSRLQAGCTFCGVVLKPKCVNRQHTPTHQGSTLTFLLPATWGRLQLPSARQGSNSTHMAKACCNPCLPTPVTTHRRISIGSAANGITQVINNLVWSSTVHPYDWESKCCYSPT